MTERELAKLDRDVAAWESLERAVGQNHNDLDYPADLSERITQMAEENGDELVAGIEEWEEVDRPADESAG